MSGSRWSRVLECLAVACVLAASGHAQDGLGPRRRDAVTQQVEPSTDADLERGVQLPTQRCGDVFFVDAMINGHGPFVMLLDTGASVSVLSTEAAKACGLLRHMDELSIGPVRFQKNLRCVTRDLEALRHAIGVPFDGIMGHAVFADFLLTYDYPAGQVSVRTGQLSDDMPAVSPMRKGARPFVRVIVDGHRSEVLLDTGFTGGLMLTGLSRLPLAHDPVPIGGRLGIDGLRVDKAARLDADADLGCLTLRDPIVQSADGEGLLGQRVLRAFILTVDQRQGRYQLVRSDGSAPGIVEQPEPLRGLGVLLDKQADRMVVLRVFDGSPAESAGLREGDSIIAIDGVPIAQRGCALTRSTGSTPRLYRLMRNGQPMDIEIADAVLVQ